MRLTRLSVFVPFAVFAVSLTSAPAFAQAPKPAPQTARLQPAPETARPKKNTRIPIAVLDARGVFARLGQDVTTASGLSTTAFELPATGLGLVGGAHVYLWRGQSMAFGVGGEAMLARASRELTDSTGKATGTVINRRLRAASAQLSLNFGHRSGWSYLTAGIGPTSFESYLGGATPDGLRPASLNFGGGARWFNFEHLAFTVDMRFYATKPALATPNTAQRLRKNLVVLSGGIALK